MYSGSFLMTVSLRIDNITIQHVKSRKADVLAEGLNKACNIYGRAIYIVNVLLLDPEFEKAEEFLSNVFCNFTAAREHVPVAERKICTIKERGRGTINLLPFAKVLSRMIIELIYNIVLWLNNIPSNVGISKTHFPREILTGTNLSADLHCRLDLGAYVEVHHEPKPLNGMNFHTIPAINMGPTRNL